MISSTTASIGMACLGKDPGSPLEINKSDNKLLLQYLLLRFLTSKKNKKKKDTQSEPTKANNETRQYIQQATHNNNLSLNFPKATIFKHT